MFDFHRRNADGLMDRNRAADADRNAFLFVALERKDLSERTHVHPFFTSRFGLFFVAFESLHRILSSFAEAGASVIRAFLRLHKNAVSQILHTVADFPFNAYIRNFTVAVIIGSRMISAERIAVSVGIGDRDKCDKIDFVFEFRHGLFLRSFFVRFV